MSAQQPSATGLGAALVTALAERDFARLADTLTPDARMRALIPPGPRRSGSLSLGGGATAGDEVWMCRHGVPGHPDLWHVEPKRWKVHKNPKQNELRRSGRSEPGG